jgi:glycerol kinase
MQFQADVLGRPVDVAHEQESTALGAAALAALGAELIPDIGTLEQLRGPSLRYEPGDGQRAAAAGRAGWSTEIRRTRLR